jgi:hypothetical protein
MDQLSNTKLCPDSRLSKIDTELSMGNFSPMKTNSTALIRTPEELTWGKRSQIKALQLSGKV